MVHDAVIHSTVLYGFLCGSGAIKAAGEQLFYFLNWILDTYTLNEKSTPDVLCHNVIDGTDGLKRYFLNNSVLV